MPATDPLDDESVGLENLRAHPDVPVLGPITGTWSRSVPDDTWYWSDEKYVIHGFAPGDVVPTTELVLRHKHPEDVERATQLFTTATDLGTPFANWHRPRHDRRRRGADRGHGIHGRRHPDPA